MVKRQLVKLVTDITMEVSSKRPVQTRSDVTEAVGVGIIGRTDVLASRTARGPLLWRQWLYPGVVRISEVGERIPYPRKRASRSQMHNVALRSCKES